MIGALGSTHLPERCELEPERGEQPDAPGEMKEHSNVVDHVDLLASTVSFSCSTSNIYLIKIDEAPRGCAPPGHRLRSRTMPRAPTRATKRALAHEAWRLLFQLLMSSRPGRDRVLEKLGLTPNDSKALASLQGGGARPIGALAREWSTDPSNATWVVDRLEKLKLAERRPSPDDRRVKLVRLTKKGARVQREIMSAFLEPPAALRALSDADLHTLIEIVASMDAPKQSK
jgi:DNA-binding MarR family transcriptional regulator